MKTERYWWIFKQRWYSVCSAHRISEESCLRCRTGQWRSEFALSVSRWVHKRFPNFWMKWVNRRYFNKTKRFLENTFPNLKIGVKDK